VKYLIYTETYPSGDPASPRQTGIGRYCADLAGGLAQLDQTVVVLTNRTAGDGGRGPAGVRVVATGAPPDSLRSSLARGRLLDALIREERPDHLLVGDPLAHRVVSLRRARLAAAYRPLFYGSELLAMERLLGSPAGPRAMPVRYLTRRYLDRAAEAVCISRYTADLLHRVAPRLGSECIVYPSISELVLTKSVDSGFRGRFRSRLRAAAGAEPIVVLTVARISDRKNQLGVLRALALLHATTPHRFHYVILGNLDAEAHREYLDSLNDFIEGNSLKGSVSFISNATDEEKVDYIDTCDIFVMLSRTVGTSVEGFGISAIEASCRGKPVLVSDQGGMPETIVAGRTGVAVPPDATEMAAAVLAQWAADPGLRLAVGAAGQEFSRSEFTPLASASRLHYHLQGRSSSAAGGR
jgi:glycosyltransferase involved in cell wall biosynthesis